MTSIEKLASEYAVNNDIPHSERNMPAWHYSCIDFKAGYQAAIEHLSKQTDFEAINVITHRSGYCRHSIISDDELAGAINPEYHKNAKKYYPAEALSASQARVAELEQEIDRLNNYTIMGYKEIQEDLEKRLTDKTEAVEELVKALDLVFFALNHCLQLTEPEKIYELLTKHAKEN